MDNVVDDDLLDVLKLDLAGEALTLIDTIDPTIHDDVSTVLDGSRSNGDAETVISKGPAPGAQEDRSSEPEVG